MHIKIDKNTKGTKYMKNSVFLAFITFALFFSSFANANITQTTWVGSGHCLATVNINANNFDSILEAAENALSLTLQRHPNSRFYTGPGRIYTAQRPVATVNTHLSIESCVLELETQCTTWTETLETQLSSLSGAGLVSVTGISLLAVNSIRDPGGTGCWPVDNDSEENPEPSLDPSPRPGFNVRDNFVRPPDEFPVLLPIPAGPLGPVRIVTILPSSKIYPFAAEVARILADESVQEWVKNSILATLGISGVASILMAVGGVTNGGVSTSMSYAPIIAAGAAIIWICKLGGVYVNPNALKLKSGSYGAVDIKTELTEEKYVIQWENKNVILEQLNKNTLNITDEEKCVQANSETYAGNC